jgi:hypothetical protein
VPVALAEAEADADAAGDEGAAEAEGADPAAVVLSSSPQAARVIREARVSRTESNLKRFTGAHASRCLHLDQLHWPRSPGIIE